MTTKLHSSYAINMSAVDSTVFILAATISAFSFILTLRGKRKYSARIIIYSVFSEMGKHLPGAALNLKKTGEVYKLFLAPAFSNSRGNGCSSSYNWWSSGQ